jgi:hypothetical protein
MPVVNVNLVLDEATYKGVMDGALELYGMVKDQKHCVRKHLPTVFDSAKEGASKAIDIVRNHKKELLIVGGLVIVGGAVIGTVSYFTQKEKRQAKCSAAAEADHLTLRQVKKEFGLDLRQVFRYRNVCHVRTSFHVVLWQYKSATLLK